MTNVYGTIQIVAAALHVSKMGYQKLLYILPTIHMENTDQLCSGHWLIEANGHCGQISVEYDQVRLAATGF